MNSTSLQGAEYDGSENDGINVVLLGGVLLPVVILLVTCYSMFRRSKRKR